MIEPDDTTVEVPTEFSAPDAVPGQQSELDLGVVATGHPAVDAALSGLAGLTARPIDEHPRVFEDVHRQLDDAMSSAETDPPATPAVSPPLEPGFDEVGTRRDA